MNKTRNVGLSVGTSSILVIFVLLCLTTFATLSMVSANADFNLTERAAEAVADYYAADAAAEERLARIVQALHALRGDYPGDDYLEKAMETLPGQFDASCWFLPDGTAIAQYRISAGSTQELSVQLELIADPDPYDYVGYVRRLEWKLLNLPDAAPIDEGISGLWGGDSVFLPLA